MGFYNEISVDLMVDEMAKTKYGTGDNCDECSDGRIALMSTVVAYAEIDSEPYEAGKEEGEGGEIKLDDSIPIGVHACDKCGKIFDAWIDRVYDTANKAKDDKKILNEVMDATEKHYLKTKVAPIPLAYFATKMTIRKVKKHTRTRSAWNVAR